MGSHHILQCPLVATTPAHGPHVSPAPVRALRHFSNLHGLHRDLPHGRLHALPRDLLVAEGARASSAHHSRTGAKCWLGYRFRRCNEVANVVVCSVASRNTEIVLSPALMFFIVYGYDGLGTSKMIVPDK